MQFKKLLTASVAALGLSLSAQASEINVGGVVWDPDAVNAFPSAEDFFSRGNIFENGAINPGDIVNGFGIFDQFNSDVNNTASFCPGCELTFTFSMELVAFTPIAGGVGSFEFKDLMIDVYVDHTPEYAGLSAQASDGNLWLQLEGATSLTGIGTNLGTGSDTGTGSANLNVVGGIAASNFDTNGEAGGADLILSSSFQPGGPGGLLKGGFELTGNSIPEPTSIALLGLGMLGFAASRKRKG